MITLYGTVTSPFVRRVRVVCLEKNVACTMVDTTTPAGADELKRLSPIAKVPVARFADGRVVYDSRVILDEVCHDGWAPLRQPATDIKGRVDDENAVNLVDEALLSLIRVFYVKRDGGDITATPMVKELNRARAIMMHLNEIIHGNHLTVGGHNDGRFGRPELAAVSAFAWMRFRDMFPLSTTPWLEALLAHWSTRPSLAQTAPPT